MISFDSVDLCFGERQVLSGCTFTFEHDSTYIIQAPSGTGKSSVLNLTAGYLAPTAGTVRTNGAIEYLMQDELLFSELSVAENLRIRATVTLRDADAAARDRAVADALGRLGLSGRIDERVGSLSGGERRRVELAGTLLSNPSILLLDEPVANLDAATAAEVYAALWSLRHDRTVVVVTHEPAPAMPESGIFVTITQGALSIS